MHRSFAVACLVGLSAAISHAGEWSSSQLTNIEIPTVFRTSRIVPLRSVSPAIRRHLPVFVLKTSGPSNGNVVSLTEPDDPSESDFEDSKFAENDSGFIRVPQGEPLPEYQSESTYPPVNPLPRPTPFEAVPLDGATFEDEIAIEESSKKRPADGRSSLGWIAGQNDQLGMVELDFESLSQLQYDPTRADQTFLDLTFGAKWLNGPNITDLPPQLFNILINIGQSFEVNDRLRVDAMLSPGWYTDFSNKGVEAFRLPWHLVSYYRMDSDWYWVMGVTDLSRRDIRYLPVVGAVYAPSGGNVRLDLVFPKPKIAYRVRENSLRDGIWLTMSGELGGGSWAISREDRAYDVVTLRDYRLLAGVESRGVKGQATRLEAGWIFDRSVEYQSGIGNYNPTDSFIIRVSADY